MLSPLERKSDDEKVRRTVCIRMRSDRERHARAGLLHACTWLGGARIRGMREWYFRFEYANVEKNGDEWNKNVISPQLLLSTFKKKRKKKETIFCMYDRCCNRWSYFDRTVSLELNLWKLSRLENLNNRDPVSPLSRSFMSSSSLSSLSPFSLSQPLSPSSTSSQ